MNERAYAALRRLSTVVYFPVLLICFSIMLPMSIFTWIITGKDIEEQMDWFEDKNESYWDWVKR